jgi:hypothetical protein
MKPSGLSKVASALRVPMKDPLCLAADAPVWSPVAGELMVAAKYEAAS